MGIRVDHVTYGAVKAFSTELAACVLLFLIFFQMDPILEGLPFYYPWIAHFILVLVHDSLTGHCTTANPAVLIALNSLGKISMINAASALAGQITAAMISFELMEHVAPRHIYQQVGCPNIAEGITPINAAIIECILTYILIMSIFAIGVVVKNSTYGSLSAVAVVLRILMTVGGPYTGASMNPVVGLGCLHRQHSINVNDPYSQSMMMVYLGAPMIAGLLAATTYSVIVGTLSNPSKTKSKSKVNVDHADSKEVEKLIEKHLSSKDIVSFDVRSRADFDRGHIKGAKSYPAKIWEDEDFVRGLVDDFKACKVVVVYGPDGKEIEPKCASRFKAILATEKNKDIPRVLLLSGGYKQFSSECKSLLEKR